MKNKVQEDIIRTPKDRLNISARLMYEEATKIGIDCTTFQDNHLIRMEYDGSTWFTRGSRTSLQSSVGRSIAQNKHLSKQILIDGRFPTSPYRYVKSEEDLESLKELTFPLVMKPLKGHHGEGVIVGIREATHARTAFNEIKGDVIFEELLHGSHEYRVVCIGYRFVAAATRKAAYVIGDGTSTIRELVDEKNDHPWRDSGHSGKLSFIIIDDLVLEYLEELGFSDTSVPAEGEEVVLRKTANLSTGGEAIDVTDTVHPDNKILFENISRSSDLDLIGIDVMSNTLSEPLQEQPGSGIIEINPSPGLRMHHYPMQGKARNVAREILDYLLKNKRKLTE